MGHVVSRISESGVVANAGIDVEIASPSHSVQTLFLLPVCVVAILRFPCRPMSGHVVSGRIEFGIIENVVLAAEIASPTLFVQKLFPLPICIFDIFRCRCRPTTGHVVSGRFELGMVENVGVAAEIASPSLSVQKLFLLPVCVVAILRFPCRPTSGHVVSSISE